MTRRDSRSPFDLGAAARLLLAVIASCCALLMAGCSRTFWRDQANRDSYRIIGEKMNDPRWASPRMDVTADPRSRLYDPYHPDRGPLPPDDPAAHRYMECMNGIRGYKGWHKLGEALSVENPHWLAPYGISAELLPVLDGQIPEGVEGIREMTLPQAIELANIHNREYQTEIEDLYLAALDLTFDRFQFNVRYLGLGGGEPSADLTYTGRPSATDQLALGSRFGVSQLLPAGGQIAVELANNTLWLFSGQNQTSTASVLSYSLVQPLLFGAGRKVVLEDLTQGERNVLYAARELARFRQEFFTATVAGGQAGGFLGLLLQRQVILNRQYNIRQLEEQVKVLRATSTPPPEIVQLAEPLEALPPNLEFPAEIRDQLRYDAERKVLIWSGRMTPEQERVLRESSDDPAFRKAAVDIVQRLQTEATSLDVLQLETRLAGSRNALQQDERRYQDSLDQYKTQLGLPPDLPISIDESLLDPFELIDPRLLATEDRVEQFVEVWARLDIEEPDPALLRETIAGLSALLDEVRRNGLEIVDDDFRRLDEALPARLEALETDEARASVRSAIDRDRRLHASIREDLSVTAERIEALTELASGAEAPPEAHRAAVESIQNLREELLKISQNLQVIQIDLRVELISLEPFERTLDEAVRIGLDQRVDLMNAKARVMDARRRVEVAANALQAVLDVRIEGDVNTPTGTRPLDFRGARSAFRAGLGFTAPLDLIAERNAYRVALIDYQRARREYMAFEDDVKFQIRQSWRQLEVLKRNFEITRQAVRLAALQYDQAVELANEPVAVGEQRQSGNRGLNLLEALNSVLEAQDDLIGIWVDYERNRLNIHRDMGIMEIGADGIWLDSLYLQQASAPSQTQARRNGPRKPEVSLLASPLPGSHPLQPRPDTIRQTAAGEDPQENRNAHELPIRLDRSDDDGGAGPDRRGDRGGPVGRTGPARRFAGG
ncbi:MAG: TolC family protein [Planctomycetaceae bacterium]